MRVFVDTNVLVYLFDAEDPAKQQRAREVVSELMGAGAVYSEDLQHGRTYQGVTVHDPFAG